MLLKCLYVWVLRGTSLSRPLGLELLLYSVLAQFIWQQAGHRLRTKVSCPPGEPQLSTSHVILKKFLTDHQGMPWWTWFQQCLLMNCFSWRPAGPPWAKLLSYRLQPLSSNRSHRREEKRHPTRCASAFRVTNPRTRDSTSDSPRGPERPRLWDRRRVAGRRVAGTWHAVNGLILQRKGGISSTEIWRLKVFPWKCSSFGSSRSCPPWCLSSATTSCRAGGGGEERRHSGEAGAGRCPSAALGARPPTPRVLVRSGPKDQTCREVRTGAGRCRCPLSLRGSGLSLKREDLLCLPQGATLVWIAPIILISFWCSHEQGRISYLIWPIIIIFHKKSRSSAPRPQPPPLWFPCLSLTAIIIHIYSWAQNRRYRVHRTCWCIVMFIKIIMAKAKNK